MTPSQALGAILLIVVAVAGFVLYRVYVRRAPTHYRPQQQADIQLWDAEDHRQRDFWPELIEQSQDQTMPAVLTPLAWTERDDGYPEAPRSPRRQLDPDSPNAS